LNSCWAQFSKLKNVAARDVGKRGSEHPLA
jgi:hypothetical protein